MHITPWSQIKATVLKYYSSSDANKNNHLAYMLMYNGLVHIKLQVMWKVLISVMKAELGSTFGGYYTDSVV